jgi:DNA-binding MurR/RpiR family transcriptional regulator
MRRLRDLKLKVMSSMRVGMRYLERVTPPDTLAEAQERVVLRAQRAVLAAHKTIDATILDSVIDALARSRMIYTFGSSGVSSWIAEEIHNRLFRLGLRIASSSDQQMQMMLAATVERGDFVFVSQRQQRRSHQGGAHRRGLRRNHSRAHCARHSACEGRRSSPDD